MHAPAPYLTGRMRRVCCLCHSVMGAVACLPYLDGADSHTYCFDCLPYSMPENFVRVLVDRQEQDVWPKVPIMSVEPGDEPDAFGQHGLYIQPAVVGFVIEDVVDAGQTVICRGRRFDLTADEIKDAQEAYLAEEWA